MSRLNRLIDDPGARGFAAESHLPEFVRELRAAGLARFRELGLPGPDNESWRFTSIQKLAEIDFRPDSFDASVSAAEVARFAIPDLDAITLVFVNGRYRPELSSDPRGLGDGITCVPLAEAARDEALCQRLGLPDRLGALTADTDDAFTALNNACIESGVVVHAAEGVRAERPLVLLSIATATDAPVDAHPRNCIIAEPGSRLEVIEHYASRDGDQPVYLTNAVTEVFAAERAEVHHYLLERESEAAFHISTLATRQAEHADVHSHTVLLGGRLVRNNVHPRLDGTEGHCLINGLYVGHNSQHMDNAMRVEHNAPNCRSRQFYKGIMNDSATGVFSGRIRVDEAGQQTDAVQSSRSMLLTNRTRVTTRPQLEIYADDVKCTHGATTGRVDDEAVFYFRSRGLPEAVARAMLIYAFVAEQFDRMELVPVRRLLAREMIDKLPMARGLSIEIE